MVLELKKLFIGETETESFSAELDWSTETIHGQHPFAAPVRINGIASNTAGVVRLRYQAVTMLRMPCDRCTVETEQDFSRSFEHILVASLNGEDTGELLVVEEGFRLNIDALARDDMLLEFPSKYLCKPNCKGICPKCGANLNTEACRCTDKPIDPRLEVLKNLLG